MGNQDGNFNRYGIRSFTGTESFNTFLFRLRGVFEEHGLEGVLEGQQLKKKLEGTARNIIIQCLADNQLETIKDVSQQLKCSQS